MAAHELNELYLRILNSKKRLQQLKKMCTPNIVLRTETRILRGTVEDLLCDDEIAEFIAHIGADAFINSFNHIAGIRIGFPIAATSAAKLAA